MRVVITSFLFCFIGITNTVIAQKEAFIGFEGRINTNTYNAFDPIGNIKSFQPIVGGAYGVTITRQFHKNFAFETGLIVNEYSKGFYYSSNEGGFFGHAQSYYFAFQVPLRLKSRVNLYKNRIYGIGKIGFLNSFKSRADYFTDPFPNDIEAEYFVNQENGVVYITVYKNSIDKRYFPLLEVTTGVEFNIIKDLYFSISGGYAAGLIKIYHQDISYSINNGITNDARMIGKGSYWNFRLGLSYSLNSIIQGIKKKKEEAKENL